MNELHEIISNRMRSLMKKEGFSQKHLADLSKLSPDTISKAVNKGKLSVQSAKLISAALGVSLDFLYGNSESQDSALEIIDANFTYGIERYSYIEGPYSVPTVKISPCLANYFRTVYEAESKEMPPDLREQWLARARKQLSEEIEASKGKKVNEGIKYVLVEESRLTDDILNKASNP